MLHLKKIWLENKKQLSSYFENRNKYTWRGWKRQIAKYKHMGDINVLYKALHYSFINNIKMADNDILFLLERLEVGQVINFDIGVNPYILYEFCYKSYPTSKELEKYNYFKLDLDVPLEFLKNCRLLVGFHMYIEWEYPSENFYDSKDYLWDLTFLSEPKKKEIVYLNKKSLVKGKDGVLYLRQSDSVRKWLNKCNDEIKNKFNKKLL
jgi:hypothetical protein